MKRLIKFMLVRPLLVAVVFTGVFIAVMLGDLRELARELTVAIEQENSSQSPILVADQVDRQVIAKQISSAFIILVVGVLLAFILVYYLARTVRDSLGNEQTIAAMQKKLNDKLAHENIERHEVQEKLEQMNQTGLSTHELEEKNLLLTNALKDLNSAHEQIIMQERMASIGQLAAGIAHEIKNPLNFVNNFSEISNELLKELRDELMDSIPNLEATKKQFLTELIDDIGSNLTKVVEHGRRADNIIQNMLHHSRNDVGFETGVDINALLKEHLSLAYHGMRAQNNTINVSIVESYDPNIGPVKVAPMSLGRAFLNIINNAIYATNEKKLLLHNDEYKPTITVKSENAGDNFIVRIRDNGSGIPTEIADKIYQPFFTTKPIGLGTGLGLSICKDIVIQQHSGTIEIDTKPGEYTEFVVKLHKITPESSEE